MSDVFFLVTYAVLWLLVVLLSTTVFTLAREVAMVKQRVGPDPGALATTDGPRLGDTAPKLHGELLTGGQIDFVPKRTTLVLFVSPHCDACLVLLPEVVKFMKRGPDVDVVMVGSGAAEEFVQLSAIYRINVPLILDPHHTLEREFEIKTTPLGLALDADWVVRSKGIVNDAKHLEALARFQMTVRDVGLNLHERTLAEHPTTKGAEQIA
jgi:methylamine dehydrogenase accessory protein MauD